MKLAQHPVQHSGPGPAPDAEHGQAGAEPGPGRAGALPVSTQLAPFIPPPPTARPLLPEPIMAQESCLGYSPTASGSLLWCEAGTHLVYPSHKVRPCPRPRL